MDNKILRSSQAEDISIQAGSPLAAAATITNSNNNNNNHNHNNAKTTATTTTTTASSVASLDLSVSEHMNYVPPPEHLVVSPVMTMVSPAGRSLGNSDRYLHEDLMVNNINNNRPRNSASSRNFDPPSTDADSYFEQHRLQGEDYYDYGDDDDDDGMMDHYGNNNTQNAEKGLAELLLGMPAPRFKPVPANIIVSTPTSAASSHGYLETTPLTSSIRDLRRRIKSRSPDKHVPSISSPENSRPLSSMGAEMQGGLGSMLQSLMNTSDSNARNSLSSLVAERPRFHGVNLGQSSAVKNSRLSSTNQYEPAHPNRGFSLFRSKSSQGSRRAASAMSMQRNDNDERNLNRPSTALGMMTAAVDTSLNTSTSSASGSKRAKLIEIPVNETINGAVTRGQKREYRIETPIHAGNIAFVAQFFYPSIPTMDLKGYMATARRASKLSFDDCTTSQGIGEGVEGIFALGMERAGCVYLTIDASDATHSFPSFQFSFRIIAKPHTEEMLFQRKRRVDGKFYKAMPDPSSIVKKSGDLDLDYYHVRPDGKNTQHRPWTCFIASLGANGCIDSHSTQPRGAMTFGDAMWNNPTGQGAPSSVVRQRPWNIMDNYHVLLNEIQFDKAKRVQAVRMPPKEGLESLRKSAKEGENRVMPQQSALELEQAQAQAALRRRTKKVSKRKQKKESNEDVSTMMIVGEEVESVHKGSNNNNNNQDNNDQGNSNVNNNNNDTEEDFDVDEDEDGELFQEEDAKLEQKQQQQQQQPELQQQQHRGVDAVVETDNMHNSGIAVEQHPDGYAGTDPMNNMVGSKTLDETLNPEGYPNDEEYKMVIEAEMQKKMFQYIAESNRQLSLVAEADIAGQRFRWSKQWPIVSRPGSPANAAFLQQVDVQRYRDWASSVWERARKFDAERDFVAEQQQMQQQYHMMMMQQQQQQRPVSSSSSLSYGKLGATRPPALTSPPRHSKKMDFVMNARPVLVEPPPLAAKNAVPKVQPGVKHNTTTAASSNNNTAAVSNSNNSNNSNTNRMGLSVRRPITAILPSSTTLAASPPQK